MSENKEGFIDSVKKRASDIQTFFGVTLPNMIYTNDKDVDLEKLTETVNIRRGTAEPVLRNQWKKGIGGLGDPFAAKQAACESVGSGDQFEHLSSLASSEDTQSRLRCGWVYNNTNPNSGRGAYGNSEAPFKTDAVGTWMWDLNAAKEKYHTAICKDIQGCPDIDSSIYKGRCGWCTKSGKAVPIISGGVAYPYITNVACPTNQLVTKGSSCPRPKPIEDPRAPRAPGEVCTPLQNGALPRDCLIQKATAAGCSDQGSLVQALRGGSNNDYFSGLKQQKAYKIYQERALIPLNETALKTGKITIADTLNEFKRVQDHSASEANTGLKSAARDLCLNKDFLDSFDFCSEIQDKATGPFTLECLQKAFLHAGGQKAGSSFPSSSNIAQWNSLSNWAAVKARIQGIFSMTRSSNRKDQESGMMQFYGIRMQNKQNPLPYGPEIAWKGSDVKISCQRPVSIPLDYKSTGCIDDGSGEMLDKWAVRNGWNMGTPPSLSPFTPRSISNLILWVDGSDPLNTGITPANGAAVPTWVDKSGNSNNMTATVNGTFSSKSQNGLGTIAFNSSVYRSAITNISYYPLDVYVVVKVNSLTTANDVCCVSQVGADSFNSLTFSEYRPSRWHNGSSNFSRTPNAVAASNETSSNFLLMSWSIANKNFSIYRNGVQIVLTNSYSWTPPSSVVFCLGTRIDLNAGNRLVGSIAEVAVYTSQLNTTDRQKVEGYLASKWGLQAQLPADHPFFMAPRRLELGNKKPNDLTIQEFQALFEKAGCTNNLVEGNVGWWRGRPSINDVENDMNAYASLTKTCSGSKGQHEFCISGKCK